MSSWTDPITDTNVDGATVVAQPAFVASFYVAQGLAAHGDAAFDAWHATLPKGAVAYYGHGNSRKLARLDNAKALAKVRAALSPKSVAGGFQWYHAKAAVEGSPADACSGQSFEIFVTPSGWSHMFVASPLDAVDPKRCEATVAWFAEWCERFGVTHADAGFGYDLTWFEERARAAYHRILATGLRFHGVRLWHRTTARFRLADGHTLDSAGWLTYLDAETIAKLEPGAIERIEAGVTRHKCGSGVLLQAGKVPDACDVNRPGPAHALLRSVNDAIKPIRTRKWWINGFAGDPDKENRWLGRLDP